MATAAPRQQVRRVLLITLILNIVVAVGKIVLGLLTGALAITADGFHSLTDASSNVVALIAHRIADRPPDADHPYGHRRFESIAALAIGALLLVTAWEIVSSALSRLGSGERPTITPLSFGVMIATLVINLFVTTYEAREGRRLKSELLSADAAHTRSDVMVTISVIISMALVEVFAWTWIDIVAALVIVILILHAAWEVLGQTGKVLVDTAPFAPEQLTQLVQEVPSVEQVLRARSRGSPDAAQIDIDVQVAPETTADHTAAIADAIREKIAASLDGVSEVEVHFAPNHNGETSYALAARACADALGMATHEVRVSDSPQGKVLELHVEVTPGQTLNEAHQQVSQLERRLKTNLNGIADVVTHIEPAQVVESHPDTVSSCTASQIQTQAAGFLKAQFPNVNWHHFHAYPAENGFVLTMHVALPPQISIEAAHGIAEAAETRLRAEMPLLERVTIHTEPPDGGD